MDIAKDYHFLNYTIFIYRHLHTYLSSFKNAVNNTDNLFIAGSPEAFSEPSQTSKMKLSAV